MEEYIKRDDVEQLVLDKFSNSLNGLCPIKQDDWGCSYCSHYNKSSCYFDNIKDIVSSLIIDIKDMWFYGWYIMWHYPRCNGKSITCDAQWYEQWYEQFEIYKQIVYTSLKDYKPSMLYDICKMTQELTVQAYVNDRLNMMSKIQPMDLQNGKVAYIAFEEDK